MGEGFLEIAILLDQLSVSLNYGLLFAFKNVKVTDKLLVETIAAENSKPSVISAIEVIRTGEGEITKLAN